MLALLFACRVDGHFQKPDGGSDSGGMRVDVSRFGAAGSDIGRALAIAPNGDLITTGSFQGMLSLGGSDLIASGTSADIWVARFRSDGTHMWSARFGGGGYDSPASVDVDSSGDVYVGGTFEGPVDFGGGARPAANGAFVVKLEGNSGSYVWDRVFGSTPIDTVKSIAIDTNTIFIAGEFFGAADLGSGVITSIPSNSTNGYVAAYAISGMPRWAKPLSSDQSLIAHSGDASSSYLQDA